jgi:hypothetical protein
MHHGMTWAREYWPIALAVAILGLFGIPETIALFTNWSNTLSDWSRYELGITNLRQPFDKHTLVWVITMFAWVLLVGWVTYHIWFEEGFKT